MWSAIIREVQLTVLFISLAWFETNDRLAQCGEMGPCIIKPIQTKFTTLWYNILFEDLLQVK